MKAVEKFQRGKLRGDNGHPLNITRRTKTSERVKFQPPEENRKYGEKDEDNSPKNVNDVPNEVVLYDL